MERDAILLTPGPLTTTERTKRAMLRDWGSWTPRSSPSPPSCAASCCASSTAKARTSSCRCRAAAPSRSRRRWRRSCRRTVTCSCSTTAPTASGSAGWRRSWGAARRSSATPRTCRCRRGELESALRADASITHVGLIHCETGTGVLNPLQAIADVCARHGKGLIVDAMSSFAALPIDAREVRFDALVAASGKCLEGVPGMGFVFSART